ncbi:MAG TPA: hypothetical protein VE175_00265, partial [Woeseiaceae bacterium]|nr:hypothetical protein [Woeseiaceae bacterium]
MTNQGLLTRDGNLSVHAQLQKRETAGNPIRVGMIGAGATGRAIALQLGTPVPGIRLAGISNRTPANAERAYREAAIEDWAAAETADAAATSIERGRPVLTDDPEVLLGCDAIDLVIEVTGTVDFGAG